MRLKAFRIFILLLFACFSQQLFCQNIFKGKILNITTDSIVQDVQVFDFYDGFLTTSNTDGSFSINTSKEKLKLVFYKDEYNYRVLELDILDSPFKILLKPISFELNEVVIIEDNFKFKNNNLNDIVEDAIYAGKKTNKIILDDKLGNIATNNARQIYNKVGGINIFQNDDAGLQLNIGGRGLNPSRSANFNTRQNNYDISADVLGYPESYYTPPAEALREIQIVRGAASLQYGTQFGGLVNFVFKEPDIYRKLKISSSHTLGSNSLYTNFTSFSGVLNKIGYYSFINYKKGDGFRPNSNFESINLYSYVDYKLSKKIKMSFEITFLNYLAQQPGGLTDQMFLKNPFQSNRERNWFKVNWLLYNYKLLYEINKESKLSVSFFGLDAYRFALGFRDNRVDQVDPLNERDLIKGQFNNYGVETRFLTKYSFFNKRSVFLTGLKYYKSKNISEQGPGSSNSGPDFSYYYNLYPNYVNQSYYEYPNLNYALFAENIFYLDSTFSITPGLRYENINTESNGYYKSISLNLAQQPIFDSTYFSQDSYQRKFILFGSGFSYKPKQSFEIYANISQNYRSVTFADISIKSPSFVINADIKDEDGYTYDIGFRGSFNNYIRYDINYFGLSYNNRIGFIQKAIEISPGYSVVKTERSNVGDAFINGFESILDFRLKDFFITNLHANSYVNFAYTKSEYLESKENGVVGNNVEFTPKYNLKYGVDFEYKRYMLGLQYSYISDQFTDASNAEQSNIAGIIGLIPSYSVIDLSSKIKFENINIFSGINNITNNMYYTRRATGYPGPGIIPSQGINYYITVQVIL